MRGPPPVARLERGRGRGTLLALPCCSRGTVQEPARYQEGGGPSLVPTQAFAAVKVSNVKVKVSQVAFYCFCLLVFSSQLVGFVFFITLSISFSLSYIYFVYNINISYDGDALYKTETYLGDLHLSVGLELSLPHGHPFRLERRGPQCPPIYLSFYDFRTPCGHYEQNLFLDVFRN